MRIELNGIKPLMASIGMLRRIAPFFDCTSYPCPSRPLSPFPFLCQLLGRTALAKHIEAAAEVL